MIIITYIIFTEKLRNEFKENMMNYDRLTIENLGKLTVSLIVSRKNLQEINL